MNSALIETLIPYQGRFIKFYGPVRAIAWYPAYKLDLLTNERMRSSLEEFQDYLNTFQLDRNFEKPLIFHLFYEWGHYYQASQVDPSSCLAIEIQYSSHQWVSLQEGTYKKNVKLIKYPEFKKYEASFYQGREELLNGNCYQFNLTFPFDYKIDPEISLEECAALIWRDERVGAYASITSLGNGSLLISNSPECLFQVKVMKDSLLLQTMPIKGSCPYSKEQQLSHAWNKLCRSRKDQGELDMITDLLSNDLSRIEGPNAVVLKRRSPLVVPGILHQYSLIQVELKTERRLGRILWALFPGGSVTGAPKKQVMKILRKLEPEPRGFYCGSTVILYGAIKAASINIRSAVYNASEQSLRYHAGGGITLLSQLGEEYREMILKRESFMSAFE